MQIDFETHLEDSDACFRNGHGQGYASCLENLKRLARQRKIVLSKEFIAELGKLEKTVYENFKAFCIKHGI